MAQSYSDEQRRLASVLGIGTLGYLGALWAILAGSSGWFWSGIIWLTCGVICAAIRWFKRGRFPYTMTTKEWLAWPGGGAFVALMLVVSLKHFQKPAV